MTYRERREAKAERLREWADKRETAAAAVFEHNRPYTSDYAFNTQPGHIPARARIIAQEDRAHESLSKAREMSSRANGIESQLESSIYDDDPDAIERLRERLAGFEAERERYKAHNKAMRKPGACSCPADCSCRDRWARGSCSCKNHPLPSYVLSNLGGRITETRKRLERLELQAKRVERAEEAGGVAVEELRGGYLSVTFSEKPAREILDALKGAGYRWAKGSWVGIADQLPEGIR